MIKTRIKVDGKKVRLGGYGFGKYQMLALGRHAVNLIKARVARGLGSVDSPMPALRGGKGGRMSYYARIKARAGRASFRDLRLTGRMLDAFSVRYADAKKVRMDISTKHGRIAGRANERRAPWFNFSRADERSIFGKSRALFGDTVRGMRLLGKSFMDANGDIRGAR